MFDEDFKTEWKQMNVENYDGTYSTLLKRLVIQTLTLISLALDVFQLLNTCFFSLNFGRALVRERKRQEKYNGKESLWPVKCEGNDVEMSHGYQVGCYIEETNLFTLSLYIITQI